MEFSLSNFKSDEKSKFDFSNFNLKVFKILDKKAFTKWNNKLKISNPNEVFNTLRNRLDSEYYKNIVFAQSKALKLSEDIFPTYKFLMEDVVIDDWLAVIDPHKKYCRDHSLHQPLTAYIVSELLNHKVFDEKTLLDLCTEQVIKSPQTQYLRDYFSRYESKLEESYSIKFQIVKNLFYETAIKAAMFHDIGYPWQYVSRLNKTIKEFGVNFSISKMHVDEIYARIKDRLLFLPFIGYNSPKIPKRVGQEKLILDLIKDALENTHGIHSAISFLYLHDALIPHSLKMSKQNALLLFSVEWAALAIMMHDMTKLYWGEGKTEPQNPFFRLSFERDPMSAIIAIADFLEEFARPNASFSKCDIMYHSICESCKVVRGNGNEVVVELCIDREKIPIIRQNKDSECKRYFEKEKGFIDLSALKIDSVKMKYKPKNE